MKFKSHKNFLEIILETVEAYFTFSIVTPEGTKDKTEITDGKIIYSLLATKLTRYSLTEIGNVINRNYGSIINHRKRGYDLLESDILFRDKYFRCLEMLPLPEEQNLLERQLRFHTQRVERLKTKVC